MTYVLVDSSGIGPISFDRDEVEAVPQDQFFGDSGTHPIEL